MDLKVLVVQNSAIIGNKNATLNNVDALLAPYKGKNSTLLYCQKFFLSGGIVLASQKKLNILITV